MLYGLRFENHGDSMRLYHFMTDLPGKIDLNFQGRTLSSHDKILLDVLREIARERRMPYELVQK